MKKQRPKGVLIPIGGGEDKENEKDVLCRVIKESGKEKPKICLITLATGIPEEVAAGYRKAFRALGITGLDVINYDHRGDADTATNIRKVKECDIIMFSGGDQLKLSTLLGGTELLNIIKERYYDESNFVIAGTSAGAAAMSNTMIISGSGEDALMKGELVLSNGLDFINSIFVDTHFMQRGRFGRLIQTVAGNPGVLGLGLGEDTAVVIDKEKLEVVGSGLVIIVDGKDIEYSDLTEVKDHEPITVEGIKMHVLGPGKHFLIPERKLKKPAEQAAHEKN